MSAKYKTAYVASIVMDTRSAGTEIIGDHIFVVCVQVFEMSFFEVKTQNLTLVEISLDRIWKKDQASPETFLFLLELLHIKIDTISRDYSLSSFRILIDSDFF